MNETIKLPKILKIEHVKCAPRRWGTNVNFENGVILKFSGKLNRLRAAIEANRYYQGFRTMGSTDVEILEMFKSR